MRAKQLAILLLFSLLAVSVLGLSQAPQASAAGGSGPPVAGGTGAGNQEALSSYVTVSSASTGTTAAVQDVYQYDYILVPVAFEGTGQHVSTVADNDSNTYSLVGSSASNNDVELWCAEMTHATGGLKVTVTSSATATYSFLMMAVPGLTSCTTASGMAKSAHGSTAAASVASFTPTTGDFCEVVLSDNTGTSSAWTNANPFNAIYNNGGVPTSSNYAGFYYIVDEWRGSWNSNDGATTATLSASATGSSPAWDEIVDCLPTSSAGNEMYSQAGARGGTRSSPNPSAGVDTILKGDYITVLYLSQGTTNTLSSISDNTGSGNTYVEGAATDSIDALEVWTAQAQTTSNNPQVTAVGGCTQCMFLGWNIAGINSQTAQVFSATGTTASASISSSTPDAGDMCFALILENTGVATVTFSTPGDTPWRMLDYGVQSGDYYYVLLARPYWPAGVSTTATVTPSSASSPSWAEMVACFAGTEVVPLTCTTDNSGTAATVSLSESSGNALSPSSALCDGSVHNITVDPSITLTATEPTDGANTRDRFSGGGTTTTDSTCASSTSGLCLAWSFTNYEQLLNNYEATPNAQTTWDGGLTAPAVVGTVAGTAATTGCSITLAGGGGAASCSGWFDYNRAVTIGTSTIGGAPSYSQWLRSGSCSFTQTTTSNMNNCNYYKQFQNTYQPTPFAPSTWDVSGISVDTHGFTACATGNPCSVTITTSDTSDVIVVFIVSQPGGSFVSLTDSATLTWNARYSYQAIGSSGEFGEYWAYSAGKLTGDTITADMGGGGLSFAIDAIAINGANTASPYDSNAAEPATMNANSPASCTMTTSNANDMLIGIAAQQGFAGSWGAPSGWTSLDHGGSYSEQSAFEIASSTLAGQAETWTATGGTNVAGLCDAIQASIHGVTVTGTSLGSAGQTICVTTLPTSGSSAAISCTGYADFGTTVTMGVLTVSANERWAPATLTYTDAGGGSTHVDNYYEQLQNTYSANPSAPTTFSPSITFTVTGTLYGAPVTVCTITVPASPSSGAYSCNGYADYNTAVAMPATSGNNPSTGYWFVSGTSSFTDTTGGNTRTSNYYEAFTPASFTVTISLTPSLNQGLGAACIGAVSLSPSVNQALASPSSASITLSASVAQPLANSIPAALSLSSSLNQGLAGIPTAPPTTLSVDSHYYYDGSCTIGGDCEGNNCNTAANCQVTISTSDKNDVIIALFWANGGATFPANPMSDSSGLTWTLRVACGGVGGRSFCEYYAIASSALSSDTLTLTVTSATAERMYVFAVNGAVLAGSATFDNGPSGNQPSTGTGTEPTGCAMSTSNANDLLFSSYMAAALTSGPSGWTVMDSGTAGRTTADAYDVVSSTVSSQTETWTTIPGDTISYQCDAIKAAPSAASATLSLAPSLNQGVGGLTESASIILAPTLAVQSALSAIVTAAMSLAPSINQAIAGISQAASMTLSPSLSAAAALSALLSASVSMLSGVNQALGVTASAGLSLTSSVNQALSGITAAASVDLSPTALQAYGLAQSATVALSSTVNQAVGGIANTASMALSATLTIQGAFSALVSATMSLASSVGQGLTAAASSSIGLAPALAIQAALSATASATISLTATINQALGITTAASMSLSASIGTQGAFSALISSALSLMPSVNQALGAATSSNILLTPTLAVQAALSAVVSAAMSLSPSTNQAIAGLTVAASMTLSASLGVQGALSALMSSAVSLLSSVNQSLGVTTSSNVSLAPTLAVQAALSTIVSAVMSLTPTVNQDLSGVTAAAGIVLSANVAIQGALSALEVGMVSLVSSVGQGLTLTTSSNIGLNIVLTTQAALSAALSNSVSLLSMLNPGVGVITSATTSLALTLNQDLAVIAESASVALSPALNQAIAGMDQVESIALSASLGAAAALSALLSTSTSLVAIVSQALAVTTPATVLLTSSLDQALAAISDSASMALAVTVNQSISGIAVSAAIALSASLSVQAAFTALFSAAISLAASASQDLGVNSSSSIALFSALSQDLSGITNSISVALSSTLGQGIGGIIAGASVSLSPILQVGSSLSAALSYSESLIPGLSQALSNTLSPSLALLASFDQDLGSVVSSTMSLGASLNQDIAGITAGVSESLSAVLQVGASFFAALSAAVSLSSTVNQDLSSITVSASMSLISALDQAVSNALNPVLSLVASVGNDLGNSMSASLSLTSSLDQALSGSVSSAMSLAASLDQDLGGIIQLASLTITPTLSAILSGFLAVLSGSISLTSSLNQSLGGFFSGIITTTVSMFTNTEAARDFYATLSAGVSLSSTVSQALGSITASASLSLISGLSQSIGGIFSAIMTTTGSLLPLLQIGMNAMMTTMGSLFPLLQIAGSFFAALSDAMSLSSTVSQALGSITVSASMSLVSALSQSIGGVFSGMVTAMGSLSASLTPTGGHAQLDVLLILLGTLLFLGILIIALILLAILRRRKKESPPPSAQSNRPSALEGPHQP